MIQASDLTKTYESDGGPVTALDGLDISIAEGEFAAIMGPSGCGKSTLLNLIAGLDRPTGGQLTVNNVALAGLSDGALTRYRRTVVGVVFQFYNLLPTLTVRENIMLPALLAATAESAAAARASDLAKQVGLAHRLTHRTHQLSGGEMQRAAIARALVNDPPVILADEPTGNLDSHTAEQILMLLKDLLHRRGATVLMVTHSPEAAAVADRIVQMVDGRVEEPHAPAAPR